MPYVCYRPKRFSPESQSLIDRANTLIDALRDEGFTLTLRQLYYRLVATGAIPNTPQSYKRLGVLIGDARLAGDVDWDAIEDRVRNLQAWQYYATPAQGLTALASTFRLDRWQDQKYQPEVWVEKDALVGIVDRACSELGIPYMVCRGYMSLSEMYATGLRFSDMIMRNIVPVIIHLGDHDPSGLDMTRDVQERMGMFLGLDGNWPIKRVALNMPQIRKYKPPPNPVKVKDSRSPDYVKEFGNDCWELDALEPQVLIDLIRKEANKYWDEATWVPHAEREADYQDRLSYIAEREERHESR